MREGWRETRLGDVVRLAKSRVDPRQLGDRLLTHFSIPSLDATGLPVIEPASAIASHKFRVDSPSVLVSMLNPRIPRIWLALGADDVVCSTEFAVLSPSTPDLLVEFLSLYCESETFTSELQRRAVGTTGSRQRTKSTGLLDITLSLPPLDVQRRIVDLVGALDQHVRILSVEYASMDVLLRTRRKMIWDAHDQSVAPLRDILIGITAGRSPDTDGRSPSELESGVLKVNAIDPSGVFLPRESKALPSTHVMSSDWEILGGEVLVTRANTAERVAAVARVPHGVRRGLYLCDKTLRLDLVAGVDPDYLAEMLQAPAARLQVSAMATGVGSSMVNVTQDKIRDWRVPVPSLAAQKHASEELLALRSSLAALNQEVESTVSLRSKAMALLISGSLSITNSYDDHLGRVT